MPRLRPPTTPLASEPHTCPTCDSYTLQGETEEPWGPYIQIGGSLLILVLFVSAQLGRLAPASVPYLVRNLGGSLVLAVDAALGHRWGFLLLEGV